jgi:predicted RNA-binding protein with PUA-like domain
MTPQEKAKELIDKFTFEIGKFNAKQSALVTVNEIIESREDDSAFDDTMWENASEYYSPHPMYLNYWLKVKIEIEKL